MSDEAPKCLDVHKGDCEGDVQYRPSLSGTGTPIPRCDSHWADRLELQEAHNKRYPVHAPPTFDPSYAGESWDED
jgi:hypothetical protein